MNDGTLVTSGFADETAPDLETQLDTLAERGEIEPAGEGDGSIPEILAAVARRGFEGPASLEPHLVYAGDGFGFSGPEAYEVATEALRECYEQVGVRSE